MRRLIVGAMAAATLALAFTSFAASPLPIANQQFAVPFAQEVQTPGFQSPPFQSPQAQPQATQVQAPATPTTVVTPSTTVTATGPDTKISVGSMMSDIFYGVMALFGSTIGAAVTALILKLLGGVGENMTKDRKEQLQKLVERGLMLAAAGAKKTLDGKITVDVKSQVVADAVKYAQEHGADLIKKLGDNPGDGKTVEALEARVETALADPAVPVEVAPAPAHDPVDIKDMVRDEVLSLLKELRAAQAPKTV